VATRFAKVGVLQDFSPDGREALPVDVRAASTQQAERGAWRGKL